MQGGPEHAPGRPGSARAPRAAAQKIKSLAEVNYSSGTSMAEPEQDSDDVPLQDRIDKKAAEAVDSQAQPQPAAKESIQAKPKQSAKRRNQAQPEPPAKRAKSAPKGSDSESHSPAEQQGAGPAKKKVRIPASSPLYETCMRSREFMHQAKFMRCCPPCTRAFCDHRRVCTGTFCAKRDA